MSKRYKKSSASKLPTKNAQMGAPLRQKQSGARPARTKAEAAVEPANMPTGTGEVVLYQVQSGKMHLDVRLERDTVWLSLNQMADLFGRDKSVISRHLQNVFKSRELQRSAVVAENATTAGDGKTYQVEYFNLDAILSVGYRVNSKQGTRFRIWATQTLRDHLLRGYTLNEKRLREKGLTEIEKAVDLLSSTLKNHSLITDQGRAVLNLLEDSPDH